MKTIMPVVLGSALLAAIGYATATWYLGGQAELAAGEAFRQMERIPHLKIVKRDYRRGVFSSEETVTFELFGDVSKIIEQAHKQRVATSAEAPGSPFKALEFTMRSHIRHGPLPDGRTIAAAAADSELDVEEKFRPVLAPGAGHQKLLRAHTIYRFDGEGESLVTSPPFSPLNPSIAKGLPLSFSSAASVMPSLTPFGALHVDWPLIATTCVSLRVSSAFHNISSRRLGSRGYSTVALSLVADGPSTSAKVTLFAPSVFSNLA